MLKSFISYCEAHPDERFWQALRNWVGWDRVLVANGHLESDPLQDTFYWEENYPKPTY